MTNFAKLVRRDDGNFRLVDITDASAERVIAVASERDEMVRFARRLMRLGWHITDCTSWSTARSRRGARAR